MEGARSLRHELFIYYRVPVLHADALSQAVREMQASLCRTHPGLAARLLRRPEVNDEQHTWMEAYELPGSADVAASAAAIAQAARALETWIVGGRHVEHFLPCAW